MKNRFSTIDLLAIVNELQKFIGMRVNQVYDVDNKTYLFRLNRYEEKVVLLIESGIRIHTTEFQWPKNPSPSGFSMKLRKHLKNKRLEKLTQLGLDRIIDLQFGINDAAYHVILELYDRGNIVLTDFEYTILNILRPRTVESEDVKFVVRERYPVEKAAAHQHSFNRDDIYSALNSAKEGDVLKKILLPQVAFGPALLDHVLLKNNFPKNCAVGKHFIVPADIHRLFLCLEEANLLLQEIVAKAEGYVIQKVETNNKDSREIVTNIEFHPYLFFQFKEMKYVHYPSFDKSVDDYFSNLEGQKIDLKAFQKEKEALKKLDNVKKDHEKRLLKLHENQTDDIKKAQLIEMNSELVEKAITVIRSAIANQISWSDIQDIIKEAQNEGDPVAKAIKKLKLDINHFTMLLASPCIDSDDEEDSKPQLIDIDLGFSAYANARKYYDLKRAHAKKEQKTLESSEKAFKNAEKKTKQTLKEVAVTTSITKARKVMWFEKFLWFISSENYLIIAGRDVQQNELLVKRYMKANDLYVHADLHGASSVIIKNPTAGEVTPKTLYEAGTMSVCSSTAWDAKIVTSAWWVYSYQVSKTAPSGEYLSTGSFMIRGKKNYLTPANLIMGFGFMFKLDDESIQNHINDRCVKNDDVKSELGEDENSESISKLRDDLTEDAHIEELEDNNADSTEVNHGSSDDNDSKSDSSSNHESISAEDSKTQSNILQDSTNDDEISGSQTFVFPDTEVKLNVLCDNSVGALSSVREKRSDSTSGIIVQEHKKKSNKNQDNIPRNAHNSDSKEKQAQKRGQKGKLKKIKEKYKFQDEEERQLRMTILASAGQSKDEKKNKNKKSKDNSSQAKHPKTPKEVLHFINKSEENTILEVKNIVLDKKNDETCSRSSKNPFAANSNELDATQSSVEPDAIENSKESDIIENNNELDIIENNKANAISKESDGVENNKEPDVSDDEVDDETHLSDEIKLLNSLTGCPLPDDILMYAVPVCGPYSAMLNYKYKVKIIPGNTRRGKAAKTAVHVFLHEKAASSREKDLLRSVKDQDISRNLPGKVKIAAANLKKVK